MAKTKATIQMDFNKANKQAEELSEIANALDNLAQKDMLNCFNSIGNNWKGENADAYIKKGNIVKGNIEKVAKDLKKAAETIRKIAKNTKDAEMAALEIANNRTSY